MLNIKISLQLKFLIILVSMFSCKQLSATIIFQDSIITVKTKNAQNSFEYKYVAAKSGLNFRDSPKGKILGKFPLNTRVKVIVHTNIFDKINDGGKTLNGEWVGVQKEEDTVYVFNAFLSYNFLISDLKIYNAQPFYNEKKNYYRTGFLNLSESYFTYTENENTILPIDEELKDTIVLNKTQRKEFLTKTNISEFDKVFIYDIQNDSVYIFKVSELPAIACINIYYSDYSDSPKTERDFEFGFDLKKSYRGSYQNFAFIGKENPFQKGKLKPIIWAEIDSLEFPERYKTKIIPDFRKIPIKEYNSKESFKFSNSQYDFFIQNLQGSLTARLLLVIDSKKNEMIFNHVFTDSESSYLIPLNIKNKKNEYGGQWTGELFKNKPPIIFGFLGHSFGCPLINFLSESEPPIMILCDNRH